jgi:hypothetical protein
MNNALYPGVPKNKAFDLFPLSSTSERNHLCGPPTSTDLEAVFLLAQKLTLEDTLLCPSVLSANTPGIMVFEPYRDFIASLCFPVHMTDATNEVPKPLNSGLEQIHFIFEPVSFIENHKHEVAF